MKLTLERLLWIGVAILFAIGSLAGGIGYITQQRLHDQQHTVSATHEVLGVLDDLVIQVHTAERSFLNFTHTGQEPFAESVSAATVRADGQVIILRSRLADDPPEFDDLAILGRDVPAKLENIQQGIDMIHAQGAAAAEAFVLEGDGARLLDDISAAAGRIGVRERQELLDRQANTDRATRNARAAMVAMGALGTLMLAGLATGFSMSLRARQRTAAANMLLGAIVNSSPDAVVTRDASGNIASWNPGAERLFGYPKDVALGKPAGVIMPELEREGAWPDAQKLGSGPGTVTTKTVHLARGSDAIDVLVMGFAVGDGRVTTILQNVTERKRADEAVREAQARLQGIMDNSPAVIYLKDPEGRYTMVNHQFEVAIERPAEQIVGLTARDLFPKAAADLARQRELSVLESGGPQEWEEVVPLPGGERTFLANGFPIASPGGRVQHFCGMYLDITGRKQTELALTEATAAAAAANRAKSEFLSRMSHELRTPLNVILGFGQILQLDELSTGQEEAVGHILTAGRHLLGLIDEVLDIARLESGHVSLSVRPVCLDSLVAEALQLPQPLAEQNQVVIEAQPAPDGAKRWVMADPHRLKQVLLNLVSNAIKYNHEGGTVTVHWEAGKGGNTRLMVTDTGVGIPAAKFGRLFSPFDRLGAETTEVAGTGLGLALSKQLVEAMGGAIGAESTAGEGSTFWVDLPPALPLVQAEPEDAAASALIQLPDLPTGGQSILYIEDNLANVDMVERLLSRWPSVRLIPAMQGRMGLDLAREHLPDLIVLDLNLPDVPGDEVLRQLKAEPQTRNIPVIVASADAMPEQIERLKAMGAISYFTKPFEVREFLAALGAALSQPGPDSRGGPS